MKSISIREFFDTKKKDFALSLVTEPETLDKTLASAHINRPGLALSGYLDFFSSECIQVFGEVEVRYLQSLDENTMLERARSLFKLDIPCIIVTKGLSLPPTLEYLGNDLNIPIISSRFSTAQLIAQLLRYLHYVFAPEKKIHATLVDVFGLGILLSGKSGIGKSECALDLIQRGHSLVADDMVAIKVLDEQLVGKPARDFGHFMEIRGVGFINVERMFGIERVRKQKNIDLQIELMPWQDNLDYERVGLVTNFADHLGFKVPIIYLPISPGKNVSVIVEVAAKNMILKGGGYDAAEDFNLQLHDEIRKQTLIKSGSGSSNAPNKD
ncbi:MAG: HPr(Ser) kinase/phosphatase [Candidatus Cloacimonadaceae bacterium]|jgi:HPr kinase/phosphorylase|nr:HPr(Ser) kinase/phosphatase [Candidatus Cloacimonadota bacterium]MDX9949302.1 HPr(Ser) kinase/phosphatase [Candidatus Syntrophosphaera sp.]NLN84820.1 HPr(Ser) kinase/phosphatase [Candidatus Cloacimonadota bacterium]